MIVQNISVANRDYPNRAVRNLPNGLAEVWAEGEARPNWVPAPLILAKARLQSAINEERNRREQTSFAYLGKQIDSDPVSVQRISVAAATAQMALAASVPYSLEWSCADNTTLPLDAMGVLGMMQALGSYGLAVHMAGRTKKAEVAALTTIDQCDAYDINVGWPK